MGAAMSMEEDKPAMFPHPKKKHYMHLKPIKFTKEEN